MPEITLDVLVWLIELSPFGKLMLIVGGVAGLLFGHILITRDHVRCGLVPPRWWKFIQHHKQFVQPTNDQKIPKPSFAVLVFGVFSMSIGVLVAGIGLILLKG